MSDERVPVSFWLDNKRVNGVLAVEHGGEKLTLYKNRYYVVNGDTPNKKHYTQSSLPAYWRKIMAGEAPPSPPTLAVRRSRNPKPQSTVEPGLEASLGITGDQPQEQPAAPAEKKTPKGKSIKRQPTAPKRREARISFNLADQQFVEYVCPYCKAEHSCEVPKKSPFFETCKKCGREFAVRIKPKVIYFAETAGFKEW